MQLWPGKPYPLGATWDGNGVNVALFSENASAVELCLFGPDGTREIARVKLPEKTNQIWHGYAPDVGPGQRYGYRVHGPYEPTKGHRFNPVKLLLDPYAKAIDGAVQWSDALFGYRIGDPREDLSRDDRDSAPGMPKCVVIDPTYDWEDDRPLAVPWHDTVIYEVHVKGFTQRHPGVPGKLRGTYAGLASDAAVEHLRSLGITAVELLPVHASVSSRELRTRGLTNYWGYDSIGFFAPDARYCCAAGRGEQVNEFRDMVKTLHRSGIEVILDVVYNHTAEGNQFGPTLCFRGIDNASYYRLANVPRYYRDFTGCGNTLNMVHPRVLGLIMDSLRYWVLEMHVDGFRFDLASALARELYEVDHLGSFFDVIQQDPVISQVKLIAEPWDLGEGGYQVGNFPVGWAEWNGKYRDCVRDFWRGQDKTLAEFATRFTGSSDLYESSGRRPGSSINFVTAHDGFTLRDLVSYNDKHNEANGEGGRDGSNDNRSWNCGTEGMTDDPEVTALRCRQMRNFLATLFLSQGVPMLLGGDELGRTQGGNNNGYCQDNDISWFDWNAVDAGLLEFARRVIRLRREHPVFRRRRWFEGRPIHGSAVHDIAWFDSAGTEMSDAQWSEAFAKSMGIFLNGEAIPSLGSTGERIHDQSFLVLFNAHYEPVTFRIPDVRWGKRWRSVLDTSGIDEQVIRGPLGSSSDLALRPRSLVVLQREE